MKSDTGGEDSNRDLQLPSVNCIGRYTLINSNAAQTSQKITDHDRSNSRKNRPVCRISRWKFWDSDKPKTDIGSSNRTKLCRDSVDDGSVPQLQFGHTTCPENSFSIQLISGSCPKNLPCVIVVHDISSICPSKFPQSSQISSMSHAIWHI